MSTVSIVRHSKSAYPRDALSKEGYAFAKSHAGRFAGYGAHVAASGKWRARQTARALGYAEHLIDPRFNELEVDGVNEPTHHAYVLVSHERHPELVIATAQLVTEGLVAAAERAKGEPVLVVSHNLAISSLFKQLSGETDSFENLAGLALEVEGSSVTLRDRL